MHRRDFLKGGMALLGGALACGFALKGSDDSEEYDAQRVMLEGGKWSHVVMVFARQVGKSRTSGHFYATMYLNGVHISKLLAEKDVKPFDVTGDWRLSVWVKPDKDTPLKDLITVKSGKEFMAPVKQGVPYEVVCEFHELYIVEEPCDLEEVVREYNNGVPIIENLMEKYKEKLLCWFRGGDNGSV